MSAHLSSEEMDALVSGKCARPRWALRAVAVTALLACLALSVLSIAYAIDARIEAHHARNSDCTRGTA